MEFNFLLLGALLVIALLAVRSMIHVVPQYQRVIVFRFGTFEKVAGPGIVLLLPPPLQSVAQTVDLREFVVELPDQVCVTEDNRPVSIDLLVYEKVVDPADSFLKVQNFRAAVLSLATRTLRAVVSEIPFDQVLAERDRMGDDLREALNDATRRWGVNVTSVEIKELRVANIKGAA